MKFDSFVDSLVEEQHVLQHDIDLGSERVIVNCYLGFHFEFFFWMLTLVDVTIFTGSSRMKSCSSFLTVGKTLTFFQSKYNVFSFKTLSASSCNEYVTNETKPSHLEQLSLPSIFQSC